MLGAYKGGVENWSIVEYQMVMGNDYWNINWVVQDEQMQSVMLNEHSKINRFLESTWSWHDLVVVLVHSCCCVCVQTVSNNTMHCHCAVGILMPSLAVYVQLLFMLRKQVICQIVACKNGHSLKTKDLRTDVCMNLHHCFWMYNSLKFVPLILNHLVCVCVCACTHDILLCYLHFMISLGWPKTGK
jgi:hypothetical protein